MTSKVYPMGRVRYEYGISAKRTLPIRKRRPRNVNLEICYLSLENQLVVLRPTEFVSLEGVITIIDIPIPL
ncbi:hypothetical protein OUZ56_005477 [Daphnia magna]|uniref:Uncharacterized protein n=1 Tax=Daphnia magna TaxID=35525 RepID=A0ABQ9YSW4_9CRUS|nr:hypothetical protein OUZ56_005477 [Daphnia magna]